MNDVATQPNQDRLRDKRGRFLPGNREGSKRRGQRYSDSYALARRFSLDAVQALIDVLSDPKAKSTSRALAARTLLNYGWGKAPVNISGLIEAVAAIRSDVNFEKLLDAHYRQKFTGLINGLLFLDRDIFKLMRLLDSATPMRDLEHAIAEHDAQLFEDDLAQKTPSNGCISETDICGNIDDWL